MKRDHIWLVYRQFSQAELREKRLAGQPVSQPTKLFGWSEAPHAIELLSLQRDRKKYFTRKIHRDELYQLGNERTVESLQLQAIKLRSNRLGTDVYLITTEEERDRFEADIRKLFDSACSLSQYLDRSETEADLARMIGCLANLKPRYAEALVTIGYQNTETKCMFDEVEDIYDTADPNCERVIARLIIYSFESFVKVMKDEM